MLGPATVLSCLLVWSMGCASPGAPKPPSLQIPQRVRDLSAARVGDDVAIRFTAPAETTDGLALRGPMEAVVCRQVDPGSVCVPVTLTEIRTEVRPDEAVSCSVPLPKPLTAGPIRPTVYRIELRNEAGRSAGMSDPVYVAAGSAPPVVEGFQAEGTRLGVHLRWTAAPGQGELLLERTQVDSPAATGQRRDRKHRTGAPSGEVILQAEPGNQNAAETMDATAVEGVRYRYDAVRRVKAQLGGRTLELRSAPSAPQEIVWRDVYPPPAPVRLTALGFATAAEADRVQGYAVDLVWEPVDDRRVTGYLVQRTTLTANGSAAGMPERLTREPVVTPAFHDATASATASYRYEVNAVDAKGNTSPPATAEVHAAVR